MRMGSVAFDLKKVKGKVVFDEHTAEVVGFTQDAFELDIILEEFKKY